MDNKPVYNFTLKNNMLYFMSGTQWYQVGGAVLPVPTELVFPPAPKIISDKK